MSSATTATRPRTATRARPLSTIALAQARHQVPMGRVQAVELGPQIGDGLLQRADAVGPGCRAAAGRGRLVVVVAGQHLAQVDAEQVGPAVLLLAGPALES